MHEGYVYHDRKMMKWMPFNALLEQGDHVSELLLKHTYKQMPVLSDDQLQDLNYKLQEAVAFHLPVEITYYENNHYHTIEGIINRVDPIQKQITIDTKSLSVLTIIDITLK